MKMSSNIPAVVILTLIIGVLLPSSAVFAEKSWTWLDFSEASTAAMESHKHLIVNFYSIGCYWCKKIDRDTYGDSTIVEKLDSDFVGTKVNIGSNRRVEWQGRTLTERELAGVFRVRGTPYTAFVDTTGKIVGAFPGYVPPSKLEPMLKYVSGYWYNELTFQEFLASEEALRRMGSNP